MTQTYYTIIFSDILPYIAQYPIHSQIYYIYSAEYPIQPQFPIECTISHTLVNVPYITKYPIHCPISKTLHNILCIAEFLICFRISHTLATMIKIAQISGHCLAPGGESAPAAGPLPLPSLEDLLLEDGGGATEGAPEGGSR